MVHTTPTHDTARRAASERHLNTLIALAIPIIAATTVAMVVWSALG